MKKNNHGFTLIETILALLVSSICIVILSGSLRIIKNINYDLKYIDDNIHLKQMRLIIALSNNIKINGNNLSMQYQGNEVQYLMDNNKLILTPGYQVFLEDIDKCDFIKKDNELYIQYHRKNKTYERVIFYEQ